MNGSHSKYKSLALRNVIFLNGENFQVNCGSLVIEKKTGIIQDVLIHEDRGFSLPDSLTQVEEIEGRGLIAIPALTNGYFQLYFDEPSSTLLSEEATDELLSYSKSSHEELIVKNFFFKDLNLILNKKQKGAATHVFTSLTKYGISFAVVACGNGKEGIEAAKKAREVTKQSLLLLGTPTSLTNEEDIIDLINVIYHRIF